MGGSRASTSFPLPPAEDFPSVSSGICDNDGNLLHLVFSEPVQAASLGAGAFTAVGSSGGSTATLAQGAIGSSAVLNLTRNASAISGTTATLTGNAGVSNLVSTATGLPVQPFTGLVIPITF